TNKCLAQSNKSSEVCNATKLQAMQFTQRQGPLEELGVIEMIRPLLAIAALVAMTTASHATGCAVVVREGLVDGYLNLRAGPGTVYPTKTGLLPGAVVFVSNNYVGNWWNVESFSQHLTGWVNSRWLKPIDCGFASASPPNAAVVAPSAPPPPIDAPS